MAYQINGINIPQSIYERGDWSPPTAIPLKQNGLGEVVSSQVKIVRWKWSTMSKADFDWWRSTILGGLLSLRCAVRLPNENWTEVAYSVAIVKKPTFERVTGGKYRNVEIEIEILA